MYIHIKQFSLITDRKTVRLAVFHFNCWSFAFSVGQTNVNRVSLWEPFNVLHNSVRTLTQIHCQMCSLVISYLVHFILVSYRWHVLLIFSVTPVRGLLTELHAWQSYLLQHVIMTMLHLTDFALAVQMYTNCDIVMYACAAVQAAYVVACQSVGRVWGPFSQRHLQPQHPVADFWTVPHSGTADSHVTYPGRSWPSVHGWSFIPLLIWTASIWQPVESWLGVRRWYESPHQGGMLPDLWHTSVITVLKK